ncbi:N-acetylmannosamine-6-phosphate 2-epimerase [Paenibacillus ehimensis]|uniref:N-acetylmannosamine-6-phosphate 2-epimerase n=1 Tax=Paenibacillus ehimensis TaxID=79264 RepID=UPI002DB79B37|nr:N-acetylmannosamine-6-phosphate 2-epimerase [Paenibacillus ehimensis]MEC0213370.1 N-acetylmannosamine-6-phosphate 2-epimerase [Paenibacillus ehimensis]
MTSIGPKRLPMPPGLIVSCQAFPGEPLYGEGLMARMAEAAVIGGAVAIRTNGADDIRSIKAAVRLPVIGLLKRDIPGSAIYITPELEDVEAVLAAGADIVALDVTNREGRLERVVPLLERIREAGALAMADVSTEEEGLAAERLGFDIVSTTLSGYTPYSPQTKKPDLELVRRLSARLTVPLAAEGRIFSTEEADAAIEAGATFVVVGGAITRPQLITQRFAEAVNSRLDAKPAAAGSGSGQGEAQGRSGS